MDVHAILLFESGNQDNLYPFSIMHCPWELRCGAFRLFEKIQKLYPVASIKYQGRDMHHSSFLARFPHSDQTLNRENIMVLHPAILPSVRMRDSMAESYKQFKAENGEDKTVVFCVKNSPFATYIPAKEFLNPTEFDKAFLPKFLSDYSGSLHHIEVPEPKIINFLWDCLDNIHETLDDDFEFFDNHADFTQLLTEGVHLFQSDSIKIGNNAKIAPGVVLDASEGPIIIGDHVRIMPHSAIMGPCFIGDNSIIKIGAKIYENTLIGEFCKIGGEVENSIIHAFSNKQHDGFLGHSYISEWVNLGADTNTSDLKNTYANIKVDLRKRRINTNRMFLGLLCGDHTKSAIASRFTTGTVVGISSILFADGFMPRAIPSFAWGGQEKSPVYQLDKAIDTARTVMLRRNKILLDEEVALIKQEFDF